LTQQLIKYRKELAESAAKASREIKISGYKEEDFSLGLRTGINQFLTQN
jgi:hypothetical protein